MSYSIAQSAWRREHSEEGMVKFRFQDLEIWKDAIGIAHKLFDIADGLEEKRRYRFAEQLRGAGVSMSKRSTFENANILILLEKRGLIKSEELNNLLEELDHLCRKITNFKKSLSK